MAAVTGTTPTRFRRDLLSDQWVACVDQSELAPPLAPLPAEEAECTFCGEGPGVPSIAERSLDREGTLFNVRVVPHRFALVRPETPAENRYLGLCDGVQGAGAHEILLESPNHEARFATMPPGQVELIVSTLIERLFDLQRDHRFRHLSWLRRQGLGIGQSRHPLSQIFALPVVPQDVARETDRSLAWYRERGRCLQCDLLTEELQEGSRILQRRGGLIAYLPYAGIKPFAIRILPETHQSLPAELDGSGIIDLAALMRDVDARLSLALPGRPCLWSLDLPQPGQSQRHWRIDVSPYLYATEGLTLAGLPLNPVPPEVAAAALRRIDIASLDNAELHA